MYTKIHLYWLCSFAAWKVLLNCCTAQYCQGLTLRFQARGPKRSLDKNMWSKTGILVKIHTILGPMSEKSRGPQQILWAPGKVKPWLLCSHVIQDLLELSMKIFQEYLREFLYFFDIYHMLCSISTRLAIDTWMLILLDAIMRSMLKPRANNFPNGSLHVTVVVKLSPGWPFMAWYYWSVGVVI